MPHSFLLRDSGVMLRLSSLSETKLWVCCQGTAKYQDYCKLTNTSLSSTAAIL